MRFITFYVPSSYSNVLYECRVTNIVSWSFVQRFNKPILRIEYLTSYLNNNPNRTMLWRGEGAVNEGYNTRIKIHRNTFGLL